MDTSIDTSSGWGTLIGGLKDVVGLAAEGRRAFRGGGDQDVQTQAAAQAAASKKQQQSSLGKWLLIGGLALAALAGLFLVLRRP